MSSSLMPPHLRRGALAALALVAVACGSSAAPTAAPTSTGPSAPASAPGATPAPTNLVPTLPEGHLGEALAMAGPLPREVDFTDWAAIREAAGAEALTGASSFDDKARAIRNDLPIADFGLRSLRTQSVDWGFDPFDLDWAAKVYVPGGIVWLLRLRDGHDVAELTDLLDDRGFSTETLPHGTLRSLPRSAFVALKPSSLLQSIEFMNTGVLDDKRTLVLSATKADLVRAYVAEGSQPVADLSLLAVAELLEQPATAVLQVGDLCAVAAEGVARYRDNKAPAELLARVGTLHAYNALGFGYAWRPDLHGRIVLGYPIAADAAADLEGRRLLASEGMGLGGPYHLTRFSVTDAAVEGRAIVFDVGRPDAPVPSAEPGSIQRTERLPAGIMSLAFLRDLLFGICSA